MPSSHYRHIKPTLNAVSAYADARSILDVGPGFGKYGVLLRELFDIKQKRCNKKKWQTKIDCIEIWQKYISPLHNYIYNTIHVGDASQIVDTLQPYDLILILDTIEHFEETAAASLLLKLYEKANKALIISSPNIFSNGHNSEWPNPYEAHLSFWNFNKLQELFPNVVKYSNHVYLVDKVNA